MAKKIEVEGKVIESNVPTLLADQVLAEFPLKQEKVLEIKKIIYDIDDRVKQWEELSNVSVKDHTDTKGIKLAGTNRKIVKRERNELVNFIKSKREEVQSLMAEYVIEDKAYLKLSQFYANKGTEIEAKLSEIEEIAAKHEREQRELKRIEREEQLLQYVEDVSQYPVADISEEAFQGLLATLKLQKEQRDREVLEAAERLRKQELLEERLRIINEFGEFATIKPELETSEEMWNGLLTLAKTNKEAAEKQQKEQEKALQKELAIRTETLNKRNEELATYAGLFYVGKNSITIETTEERFQEILSNAKAAFELNKTKQEKETLHLKRKMELTSCWDGVPESSRNLDFSNLSEEEYQELLKTSKEEYEVKAAARKEQEAKEAKSASRRSDLFKLGCKYNGQKFEAFGYEVDNDIFNLNDEAYTKSLEELTIIIGEKKKAIDEENERQTAQSQVVVETPETIGIVELPITKSYDFSDIEVCKEYLNNFIEGCSIPVDLPIDNEVAEALRLEIITTFEKFKKWAKKEVQKLN